MKDFLKKLEGKIQGLTEGRLEKAEAPHPLALRQRILDEIEDEAERAGEVAAGTQLVVHLAAREEAAKKQLEETLLRDDRLANEIRERLVDRGAGRVEVAVRVSAPGGAQGVDYFIEWQRPEAQAKHLALPASKEARLVVLTGKAEQEVYALDGNGVVYVGRLTEVVDEEGRLVRRNDVAFLEEGGDEAGATVSRRHAHLRYDEAAGAYRLSDDDSARGTALYRPGKTGTIPVMRRGVLLQDGDVIYFGQASARFEQD